MMQEWFFEFRALCTFDGGPVVVAAVGLLGAVGVAGVAVDEAVEEALADVGEALPGDAHVLLPDQSCCDHETCDLRSRFDPRSDQKDQDLQFIFI